LRGRGGAEQAAAYAYLLLPRGTGPLFDVARRRISAIKRHT
jgi:transcription-repair coupling factor (superfamily II helicase)